MTTQRARFCRSCGQPLDPGIRFCGACGAAVDGSADAASPKPLIPRGWLGGAVLLAGAFAVVVVVMMVVGGRGGGASTAMAELVPADTDVFIAFNTDLTSRPWIALPRLLDALDTEDDARDARDEALEEVDTDYERDISPLLSSTEGVAIAVQFLPRDPDDTEIVILIKTGEAEEVRRLLERAQDATDESAQRRSVRNAEFGLEITEYVYPWGEDSFAVTDRNGVVYVAQSKDHIINLMRDLERQGPLSEVLAFRDLADGLDGDALVFGYAGGAALGDVTDRDFVDALETLDEALGSDPSRAHAAFALTATRDGFTGEMLVLLDDGVEGLPESFRERVSIEALARATPREATVFAAGTALRSGFEQWLDALRDDRSGAGDAVFDALDEIAYQSGVDIERDLVPLLTGSYAFALGGLGELVGLGWGSRITWTAPTSGDYFLRVGARSSGDSGSYTLSLASASVPAGQSGAAVRSESGDYGDSLGSAMRIGLGTTEGRISPRGDVDFFRFSARAGTRYTIEVHLGSLNDSALWLLDDDDWVLRYNDDADIGMPDSVLFLAEVTDGVAFEREVLRLSRWAEDQCGCDTGLLIDQEDEFVVVAWPDEEARSSPQGSSSLRESPNFEQILSMLPDEQSVFIYADLSELVEAVTASGLLDTGDVDLEALRGFGMSLGTDGDMLRFSVAIPVDTD